MSFFKLNFSLYSVLFSFFSFFCCLWSDVYSKSWVKSLHCTALQPKHVERMGFWSRVKKYNRIKSFRKLKFASIILIIPIIYHNLLQNSISFHWKKLLVCFSVQLENIAWINSSAPLCFYISISVAANNTNKFKKIKFTQIQIISKVKR